MGSLEPSDEPQQHLNYTQASALSGTGMLCGKVSFAHPAAQQILDALPPVLIIRREHSCDWLDQLMSLILTASYQQHGASSVVLDRLSELLFIYALQQHFSWQQQQSASSFMALYSHPRLVQSPGGNACKPAKKIGRWSSWRISPISPEQPSVTNFAVSAVGTAMQYLSWWRMQLAWDLLLQGYTVASVAEQVGYQSQAAFSRVFNKHFQLSAGEVAKRAAKISTAAIGQICLAT